MQSAHSCPSICKMMRLIVQRSVGGTHRLDTVTVSLRCCTLAIKRSRFYGNLMVPEWYINGKKISKSEMCYAQRD